MKPGKVSGGLQDATRADCIPVSSISSKKLSPVELVRLLQPSANTDDAAAGASRHCWYVQQTAPELCSGLLTCSRPAGCSCRPTIHQYISASLFENTCILGEFVARRASQWVQPIVIALTVASLLVVLSLAALGSFENGAHFLWIGSCPPPHSSCSA